jgi:exosortase/archaeosortase family protein
VFGLLKLSWVETHALLPFTLWQGRIASSLFGAPVLPIDVTLACSGADAFALCAGAILAYPGAWRLRVGGVAAGFALIVALNSIRIGTLGRAAASPRLFDTLHVYLWPAVLILLIAAFVFAWMQLMNAAELAPAGRRAIGWTASNRMPALIVWTVIFVVCFVATAPIYLQSAGVLAVAAFVARSAAGILALFGIATTVTANTVWTAKGGFEVTQECISTPLIPLYCAVVMTGSSLWRWRLVAFAAAVPLFVGLAIARLLVMALPSALIGSPLFLIHAFYQLLLAAVLVYGAATWQRRHIAGRIAVIACVVGALSMYLLGPIYAAILRAAAVDVPFNDAQGAMASLPSFQFGLYVALSVATMAVIAWRRFATGIAVLVLAQIAAFGVFHALLHFSDFTPHIRDVRAWAVAAPLAIVILGLRADDQPRR